MLPTAQRIALPLGLFLLTLLAFWPGLSGGFLFDDYPNIVHQEKVHATELSAEALGKAASSYGGSFGRPVATVSFAINHAVWGPDPWSYKLVGLLVHAANALLVFLLLRTLLPLAFTRPRSPDLAAASIALLWALHPLQVSTVLYVVQRMETLSLGFVLLAMMCYLRGRLRQIEGERAWPYLLACAPLALLGLLSKETAVLFPAYTLAIELTLLQFAANNPKWTRAWKGIYISGVVIAVVAFLAIVLPLYSPPEVYAVREFSMAERLLTQLRILPMYLGWIVLPQPGNYVFYYDNLLHSEGILAPASTLLGGLSLICLLVLALAVRKRIPLLSLGILWFFAAHLITSSVIPLELVFEHRNYFAILGVLLAGAALIDRVPTGEIARTRQFTVGVLIVGALALTMIRGAGWGDALHLAMELAERNPYSARASTDLGEQYMILAGNDPTSRFYAMAEAEFERGSRLPNSSPMPEQGLLVLAASAGQPAKSEWWDRVVLKLSTRAIGPQEFSMLTGFLRLRQDGLALDDRRFADAYLVLVNRMEMPPSQYYAFAEHALVFLEDEDLANALYRRAVDRSVGQPDFAAAMAEALVKAGRVAQAEVVVKHAQAIGLANISLDTTQPPRAPDEDSPADSGQ